MPFCWLLLVLFCLVPSSATAASAVVFTPANGSAREMDEPTFQSVGAGIIPREVVPAVVQDRAGFLWVATGDGLMRHDGYRFRHQERDNPDPTARNLGWIQAMVSGRDGRLWIGTEVDGLVAYDPHTDQMVDHRWPSATNGQTQLPTPLLTPLPTITALAENRDGHLWVGTLGGGLLRFDPATANFTHYNKLQPYRGLPDDRISALLVDSAGNLWVGTWQGLSLLRAGSDRFIAVQLGLSEPGVTKVARVATVVRALYEASNGEVWVGTADGALLRVAPGGEQAVEIASSGALERQGAVTSLVQVPDGLMWVGRTTGIDLHDGQTGQLMRQVRHDPRLHQGLAGNHVTSLILDRAGSIWVAGLGLGLQRHETGRAFRLRGVDLAPGSPFGVADTRALMQLRSGEVWAAVHRTGVVAMDERLKTQRLIAPPAGNGRGSEITAMVQAADDSIWLGSTGQLQQVTAAGKLIRTRAHGGGGTHHLLEGPDSSVWVSTDDGLYRLRPGSAALTRVLKADGQPLAGTLWMKAVGPDAALWVAGTGGLHRIEQGADVAQTVEPQAGAELANPNVLALLFDSQGSLWLDTAVSGLHRMTGWDGRRAQFDQVSARHKVHNRPFGVNLLEDAAGRVWTHMHVYDPRSDKLHALTAAEGVSFGTGWFRSHAKLTDGRLLFGGAKGILVVRADQFQTAAYAPPLVVSEIRINGMRERAVRLAQGIELQPGQRSLSVEFAALEFLQPGRHRYAYRLVGFDPDWISTGAEARVASYNNLKPGQYTLQVRTASSEGVWSPKELTLAVRVLPAWWQQTWFKAAQLMLLAIGVMAIVQLRTRLLRSQRAALQAAVSARTGELEAARMGLEQRVKERTQELSLATQAAEAANHAKTSFLLNMSHEMRTPLNAILGLMHLRRQQAKDEDEHGHLGKVENAAQYLLSAINDVLDFSKIEAGKAELTEAPFQLAAVFDGLKDMLAGKAAAKNLVLRFDLDPRLNDLPPLLGDQQRITGILLNFASNALKFTEHGVVRLSALLVDEQDTTVSLQFHVEDTGPGIASQKQGQLFNAFEQVEGPMVRKHGGVGLGLVLSRRWAEMMSGTVGLSSTEGQGSNFWFAVQLKKAPRLSGGGTADTVYLASMAKTTNGNNEAGLPASYRGQRVLLVEDDAVNQLVAAAMLQGQGLVVDVADDGAAAIRMANLVAYGLILMDIQMPNVDGLEATRMIRSAGNDPQVPVVALTAFTSAEDRQLCLDAGMNDHLGKPVVTAKLFAAVQRWLRLTPVGAAELRDSD